MAVAGPGDPYSELSRRLDLITILSQLKPFRFVLVKPQGKEAFEPGLPGYGFGDPKLLQHLKESGNYGVLAGHEYALIDTDDPELEAEVRAKLPATFEVASPGHNGTHFYYRCPTVEASKTIPVLDKTREKDKWNIGHVRIGNGYLIGPGSTHPNGKLYLVKQARPFAEITEQQIRAVLAPWLAEKLARAEIEYGKQLGFELSFPIEEILNLSQFKRSGNTLQGPHPVHGSTTGTNFHVDTRKNVWYCFRCCAGGGPLQLLAVLERVIDCDQSDQLRGEDFKRTRDIALAKGLIEKPSKKKGKEPGPEKKREERRNPWKPVTSPIPCEDPAALFNALVEWLKRYVDFKDQRYYQLCAAWIFHTWLIERWRSTGPLYALGTINSGKTILLECLAETANRGIRGGSMTVAVMFRLNDAFTPALLIDEAQLYNREEWAETQALINEGYRKGGEVWRCETGPEGEIIPRSYKAYGAKYFASSSPPWSALNSRALTLHMSKNTRKIEETLTPTFEAEGQQFRNLLQGYRDKYLAAPMPDEYPELETIKDYRTREIGKPLIAVAPEGEPRQAIISYLKTLEEEHQTEEETSYEADLIRALDACTPLDGKVTARDVRDKLADVLGEVEETVRTGDLGGEVLVRKVNEAALPKPRTIMGLLTTFGFRKTRCGGKSLAGVLWDQGLLDSLKQRYGVVK